MPKHLTVILEKEGGKLWARSGLPNFRLYTSGETVAEIEKNVRELLADYLVNEGSEVDEWKDEKAGDVQLDYLYDIAAFF
ncbi:MAG: hypothetical protein QM669_12125 [Siphonobacter sp.]